MTNMETFYDYTLCTKPSNRCDEYLQKTHLCYSVNEKSSEMIAVISCSTLRHFVMRKGNLKIPVRKTAL